MPGRDDLVQQNIARARANSQAPQPQERDGKSSSSGGLGAPRSFLGGNFEVYSALERVEFQGSLGDASLRGNTAYIRLWKRGNTSQQTSASAQASDVSDSQAELQEELEAAIDNRDAVANNFDPVTGTYGYNPYGDVDNPIEVAEANIQIAESKIDLERKKALSSQTPVSSQSASPTITVVAQTPQGRTTTTPAGSVKSANPNGFLNTLGRVGRAAIGIAGGRAVYSGGAMGSTEASAPSGEMMWQFLFNPSELELEVGPEFKNAETWGVSEKGNSGQPLHWSHNKNALLKFNSVLLNGFVFGRKVEALEQGLVELFMARDGEGQHGPHVLEFVWGKRVFGPCVIKNINIKEKMWDEGEVVNAEVSFTLEQVPEWTINDGFVDVARPGRLGTIGDPATAGSSAASPAGAGPAAGENQPPGGGASQPTQKPPVISSGPSAQFCTQATNAYSNFNTLGSKSGQSWTDNVFGSSDNRVRTLGAELRNLTTANGSVIRQLSGVDSKCSKGCPENLYYYPNTATLNTNSYIGCVRTCSYQIASKIQGSYLDNKSCPKPQFVRPL